MIETNKKTLWIFNHYAQHPGGPGGTRHYSLASHLSEMGWQVVIFASSIEHGTGRQRLQGEQAVGIEAFGSVTFVWLRGSNYSDNGLARLRNMGEYCWGALGAARLGLPKPDIILGSSVHPFAVLVASRLARRLRVPFVFEVRDLWPETIIAMGRLSRNHPIALAMRRLERHLYDAADLIISLLPKAHEYICSLGVRRDKICWLPNGVDIENFPLAPSISNPASFTFMYLGSHGIANGLDPVLRAFALLQQRVEGRNVSLRMIGDGPQKSELISLAKELQVSDCVSFESAMPKEEIARISSEADAFVANVRDLPLYKYGISLNKIFDYLAAARPIVFASNAVNNPVADAGAGVSVAADSVDEICQAMIKVLEMPPHERELMGERGRKYVEETYEYAKLARKLAFWLDTLISTKHRPV